MKLNAWKRLRALVETLLEKNLRMDVLLRIDRDGETVREATQHNCGTIGCLAGYTMCLFTPPKHRLKLDRAATRNDTFNVRMHCVDLDIVDFAGEALGLDEEESNHVFYAKWHPLAGENAESDDVELSKLNVISKKDILRYLDAVILTENPMIVLSTATPRKAKVKKA